MESPQGYKPPSFTISKETWMTRAGKSASHLLSHSSPSNSPWTRAWTFTKQMASPTFSTQLCPRQSLGPSIGSIPAAESVAEPCTGSFSRELPEPGGGTGVAALAEWSPRGQTGGPRWRLRCPGAKTARCCGHGRELCPSPRDARPACLGAAV